METKRHKGFGTEAARRTPRGLMRIPLLLLVALRLAPFVSCSNEKPPISRLENTRDSIPVMVTQGVSKLISDSGRLKYRIIAEEWRMFDKTKPPRQEFPKGIFLERFDQNFKMNMYIIADTAWCYDQTLWRLKGNVYILDKEQRTTFRTEELYWDMNEHRFYSNRHMHIKKPDRELQGNRFTANEQLTQYHVWQSKGYMPMPENENNTQKAPSDTARKA